MVDLSLTFIHCLHCQNRTAEPRNVCPVCDWPRCHSDDPPQPAFGCADPNAQFVRSKMPVINAPMADVMIVPPAPAAPAMIEAALPDLGVIEPTSSLAILRTLTLAPDDPEPEADNE